MFAFNTAKRLQTSLIKYTTLYYIVRKLYFWIVSSNVRKKIAGGNNYINKGNAILRNVEFKVRGSNNQIRIGNNCVLEGAKFYINGSFNIIEIGDGCRINRGAELWIEDERCKITIGKKTTIVQAHLAATENGSSISIGKDCMFAYDIDIRTGDSHSIKDKKTGKRLNPASNVVIEDHVWIAAHVSILKGVTLGTGCVIGTRSVVSKNIIANSVAVGIPAKVKRNNIVWTRERHVENKKRRI